VPRRVTRGVLAVILVVVVGTLRLIGSNTNSVFSGVAGTLQQK
jgi:Flp pilus assembly pilin Flp